ncbi:cysteine peptidase family C39 domain-containing protein, partial [Enterococcus faecium]|uniref:hypothetical protein n=1 Tax=Enterococcus faecium TaxID=1352 RepID=UPI001CD57336
VIPPAIFFYYSTLFDSRFKTLQQNPPLVHACVVTGYDKENIYVNDPYGVKNRAVPINDFSAIFTAMGGQMLTLEKS